MSTKTDTVKVTYDLTKDGKKEIKNTDQVNLSKSIDNISAVMSNEEKNFNNI